jgi:glycosyltransferase involved in cell wall biosynthesis
MTNKKNKHKKKSNNNNSNNSKYPFVSVCTPTYNRRPFIPYMIKCFEHQTYPKDRVEWIIIDDGTDKIEDLVKDIPQVKYFKYNDKMMLGKKRNLMHKKSIGEIIVYMDDDDYYPPTRISHAVNMLQTHPSALCSGSSEIYIYFKHINQMVQFGPYGPNHATAGTFAFKRKLLDNNSYNNEAALAEEKEFLKDYTVPFVQLEPKKTILVFSHIHNTFDKKTLLDNRHSNYVKDSDKTVDDFVKEPELKDFYMNQIDDLLKNYEPGRPEMKPDVLKQIKEIKIKRENQARQMQEQQQQQMMQQQQQMMQQNPQMMQQQPEKIVANINGQQTILSQQQVVNILKQQQDHINKLQLELQNKDKII